MEGKLGDKGQGKGAGQDMGSATKPHLRNFCLAADTMSSSVAEAVKATEWAVVAEDEPLHQVGGCFLFPMMGQMRMAGLMNKSYHM